MNTRKNYYKILGFPEDAKPETISDKAIRNRYRELALELHPDRNRTPEAARRFVEVNEANSVLSDPEKRRAYDNNQEIPLRSPDRSREESEREKREELNREYQQLRGLDGFGRKIQAGIFTTVDILNTALTGMFSFFGMAILALPFIIALWLNPRWTARKVGLEENHFDTIKARALYTLAVPFLAIGLPLYFIGRKIYESPQQFKEVAITGLTREQKTKLFLNVVLLTVMALTMFPPAGIAAAIGACNAIGSGIRLTDAGGLIFLGFSMLAAFIMTQVTAKIYDWVNKPHANSNESSRAATPPPSPTAAPAPGPAPSSSPRSTPASLAKEFPAAAAADEKKIGYRG